MSRLDELRAKYPQHQYPTAEQLRFARAAMSIKAGVEALGPEWRCYVDVWNRDPKTADVRVRIDDRADTWTFDYDGCEVGALLGLLTVIRREAGTGDGPAGFRALVDTFSKWTPEYVAQFFPPPDPRPLPLPG